MKHWYLFSAYTAFIVLVIIGAYIGMIPTEIGVIPMYDSIGHFFLYGIWFYLLHKAFQKRMVVILNFSIPLTLLILFPVVALEEFAQKFASTRTFGLTDLLWGFAGMCLFWFISRKREPA
jgi:polysaccharide biosynthesis protein VpsQ